MYQSGIGITIVGTKTYEALLIKQNYHNLQIWTTTLLLINPLSCNGRVTGEIPVKTNKSMVDELAKNLKQ